MANQHGDFIWYELLTGDADAALAFYTPLLGWQVTTGPNPEMDYRIIHATDADSGEPVPIGGVFTLTPDMQGAGARPAWLGYIAVDNVDDCVQRLVDAGGAVLMPATDIPQVGRIAMLADPEGIPFYVMRGLQESTSLAFAFDKPRPGHCAWNELLASDPESLKAFYFSEFGWSKDGEFDMGAMGAYEFIRHRAMIGAVMTRPEPMPSGRWNFYFRVRDIDRAAEQIAASGGTVLLGPDPIPGGEFIIQGLDPQGAVFALIGIRHT